MTGPIQKCDLLFGLSNMEFRPSTRVYRRVVQQQSRQLLPRWLDCRARRPVNELGGPDKRPILRLIVCGYRWHQYALQNLSIYDQCPVYAYGFAETKFPEVREARPRFRCSARM